MNWYGFELEPDGPEKPADPLPCELGVEIASPQSKSRGLSQKNFNPM